MTLFFVLFLGASALHLAYWLLLSRLAFYRPLCPPAPSPLPSVSVVLCAKNEGHRVRACLEAIGAQEYPALQLVLVDDGSKDDTLHIFQDFARSFAGTHIIYVSPEEKGKRLGKKFALAKGIAAARGEFVLLTDADCRPESPNWVYEMVAQAEGSKRIVLGFSPYDSTTGLLNTWVRFEAVYTAMQYFCAALWGLPYMGVGRNLLYGKELFNEAGGFSGHEHLASGDDDLFVNTVANARNTAICLSANADVLSAPKTSWRAYLRQKRRHLSTGSSYRPLHQALLGGFALSHAAHLVLGICCMAFGIQTTVVLAVLGAIYLLKWALYAKILKLMRQPTLLPYIVLMDMGLLLYYVATAPYLFFSKPRQWT
jgi:biofilm PGA synthesis N-glycosyltransferase PgaC